MVRGVIDRDVGPHCSWPGNVRELEQAVRRILLTHHYAADVGTTLRQERAPAGLLASMEAGALGAQQLLAASCGML
jgi:transcriptional regulator with GAF, ATPase, and Fis domain